MSLLRYEYTYEDWTVVVYCKETPFVVEQVIPTHWCGFRIFHMMREGQTYAMSATNQIPNWVMLSWRCTNCDVAVFKFSSHDVGRWLTQAEKVAWLLS